MLALPIARRELLVLSRAPSSWRNRVVISVLVFAFGSGFAVLYRFAGQMALNQAMQMLGGGLSMYCLFVGVALTADSLAREKREGTLGLLFLTNLSSIEIVLGKLLAHSLVGFYSLLCVLPLLSMSMIFGGMRFSDVLLYMISALDTLFFSAAVGIFISSICREQRKANGYGMLIVLFFWWGVPVLRMLLVSTAVPGWIMTCLSFVSINPFGSYPGLPLMAMPSAWSLARTHALAWAFIGLAVWLLPRRWQDVPVEKRSLLRQAWKRISLGKPATRLKLRRALLDQNPFLWLASRDRFQAAGMWITSIAMTIFVAWNFRKAPQAETLIALAVILSWAQQGFFSGAAASQLLQEYEQGTLEMLLSTPLSVHEVARGQWAAVLRQNRSAFALTFLLLVGGCVWLIGRLGLREPIVPAALAIYSGLFLLQLYALGWVGIWAIVTAPEPRKARTRAFLCVTGAPVLMFGALIGLANFLSWLAGIRLRFPPELLPFVFLAIAFVNSILWLRHAKRQLPEQLRLFAFRRYAPQEPLTLLGRIGRAAGHWFRRKRPLARALSGALNTLLLGIVFLGFGPSIVKAAEYDLAQRIQRGESFLTNLFDVSLQLLPEYKGSRTYWLFHDNYLAAQLLADARPDLSRSIHSSLLKFGVTNSGKIEIVFGEAEKPLPFRMYVLTNVASIGDKTIRTELVTTNLLTSWEQYADLLLLASLAQARSAPSNARRNFDQAASMWDKEGFRDAATKHSGVYATYKLALYLIAADRLKSSPPHRAEVIARLLAMQTPDGGWITDYTQSKPVGLANVETTCLALLGLKTLRETR